MRKLDVRKQGNLCTVFIEALTNTPIPFNDFHNPPAHAFPLAISGGEDAVKRAYPAYDIYNFITDPTIPPQPTVTPKDRTEEINKYLKDIPTTQGTVTKLRIAPEPNNNVLEKALGFYKLLLAQQTFAEGIHATTLDIKVETCSKLLLAIWPDCKEALTEAEESVKALAI